MCDCFQIGKSSYCLLKQTGLLKDLSVLLDLIVQVNCHRFFFHSFSRCLVFLSFLLLYSRCHLCCLHHIVSLSLSLSSKLSVCCIPRF